MQQNSSLSPQSHYTSDYTCGDPSPRLSLLFRTPRTRALWRKQDRDELLGLYEDSSNASGSSVQLPSRVCPLCNGQESTEEGRCTDCSISMVDPHGWGYGLFLLDEPSSSTQAGPLLPAFGEVTTDRRPPQSQLNSRGSSPVDLPTNNRIKADDGDEVSQRGETVAPTTDGEDEGGGDGETDTGDEDADGETDPGFEEEADCDAEPSLFFAASIPLPEEDAEENDEEPTNGESKPEDNFADADEVQHESGEEGDAEKNEAEEEIEDEGEDEASDRNEDPADNDSDGSETSVPSVRMSLFKHPDAPEHEWIAEDIALAMIVRRHDDQGKVTQAASTEEMMAIFPESQRVVVVDGRYRCLALARINRITREWEVYNCGSGSYKRRNDFRRHLTNKHLADQRPEQRCRVEGSKANPSGRAQRKRKRSIRGDEEEEEDENNNADPQADFVPPANKRARRQ